MKKLLVTSLFLAFFYSGFSQKKPLDHSVYDSWQDIGEHMISNDGKWVVYTIDPQVGDNELVIQSSDAKYKKTVARGYNAVITEDNRYVVFKIKPFYKDTREAKIKKKKADDMPKDSLAIVELGKEVIWKREEVKNYKTPQKSYGWVAFQVEKPLEQPGKQVQPKKETTGNSKIADSLHHIIDSLQQVIDNMPKKKKIKDDVDDSPLPFDPDAEGDETNGSTTEITNDLVVRNMGTGEEVVFFKVTEYYFSKTGDKLLVEQARDPLDSSSMRQVLLYELRTGKFITLSKGGNEFKNFAMTDDGSQIAYLAERDARPKELQKYYRVWYYQTGMDSAHLLLDKNFVGMKLGMTISEYGNLSFSKNGKRLFFGTAPIQAPRDTTLVEFEHPRLDIWHYNDDYLQTVQTFPVRLKNELQQNFLAVYHFDTKTIRQLGSKEIPQVLQTNEGNGDTFVGVTDFGKRVESQWTGNTKKDIYAIDVNTGEQKLVKEDLLGQAYPSSTGKYIMWYDRVAKNYFVWDGTATRNITDKIKVPFYNEENDFPEEPANYGVMGWQEGDSAVYIYDRYDVWKVSPDGSACYNFSGDNRKSKTRYRYLQVDPDEKAIAAGQKIFFRTFNEANKKSGLVIYDNQTQPGWIPVIPEEPNSLGPVNKAKNSTEIILTKENFINPPDLYLLYPGKSKTEATTGSINEFAFNETKLSSINLQQSNYLWGTSELFGWKAYNGKDATGIVFKPENFDPNKKYPMVVYFYEKLSDGLNIYREPAPIRSAINVSFFVSRGYIIFMPDIEYRIGHPGQSAYDYIVSGARALVKKGWVDSTNIAIQGHSWGGYQAAQLATMTKLFKAVWAGAPVANMTSAYGGIRWESGVSRQFQYEKSQSRIGGTLWEKLPLYIENSPLFHLDKVTAPVVIMANDADGAVPWYQGIELFTGLRRLGKKVWMFDYNGQGHGLTQRQDMRDYQMRIQKFFDWILKGEKPAKWITEGVPAVKKGKDWGLEIDD